MSKIRNDYYNNTTDKQNQRPLLHSVEIEQYITNHEIPET